MKRVKITALDYWEDGRIIQAHADHLGETLEVLYTVPDREKSIAVKLPSGGQMMVSPHHVEVVE